MAKELASLAITMLIGTLLLGVGVYLLILRLVIHPVERLEQASRSVGSSRGLLIKVPHTDRMDEIGALMRSYNSMAGEVNDLRMNLEKKVRESVAALEKTQQNLILSERLSVTGKMAAGVAHEINNPLGGMLNAARSLHTKATPGTREADYLALILDGLGRIEHIVSTMKQFGRPTGEKMSVNVREVLEGSIVFIQHRAQEQKIEIKREIPEISADTFVINGYRAALGQIFLNLMVNAIDALDSAEKNEPGRPKKLTIKLTREGDWIIVSVQDNGIGMPEEVQQRAGEMFYTTKPETHGTGLGLAIVKHILQEHDGVLEIQSKTGEGTTMRIKLPANTEMVQTEEEEDA
jgi:signal transduction histidine kinase